MDSLLKIVVKNVLTVELYALKEESALKDVRFWFKKDGLSRFISHLDTYRCMLRAIRRAKLPIWYTEGFNRHPFMTFSLPLPLGIKSENDSFNIRLPDEFSINKKEVLSILNKCLPEGISITDITPPIMKPKEISFALFKIIFDQDIMSNLEFDNMLFDFINQENIFVIKKVKVQKKQ